MTSSTIRNLHYTPSSYLDQKHQFVGYDSMKYYNTYNDDNSASCNTEEKEQLDVYENSLHDKARQEERVSQVYHNLGALKRKQAYRSILKGATIVPNDFKLPMGNKLHGVDHKYYDASDPRCPLSKDSFLHHENAEYKCSEEDQEEDYGEQYKIRLLRSHRLKQVSLKTQEEVDFLEEREEKRKQALEKKKLDALQEEQERLTIAQEREKLERERAAFEIMRQATLRRARKERKERMEAKRETVEGSRSSIDGCRGCTVFQEADDISAVDGSIFPSEVHDWIDAVSDACHKVIFCGGMMDPGDAGKDVVCGGGMMDGNGGEGSGSNKNTPPEEVMLTEDETLADTITAPEADDSVIEINLNAEEQKSQGLQHE